MTEKENIKMILEEGEGYFIEFKEYPNKIDKEMVAFANASGGRIYLGISDDGIIKGLKLTNKLKSEIQSVAENCDPSITIRIKEFTNYVIIYVNKGNRKPYRCASGFYIRNGATSQKMKTEDIVKFVHEEQVYLFDEIVDERATLRDINQEKI